VRHLLCLALAATLTACGGDGHSTSGELRLERLRGQWVVVNYWAEWCKPCIAEVPELNALARSYPDVTVFGVNFDGATGEELTQQERRLGIEFPTLTADPAPDLGLPRPVALPTTLVLDPAGQLSDTLVGPQTLASLALATGQVPRQP
jgi:thiol-disulfide isomerase/thioredoxin